MKKTYFLLSFFILGVLIGCSSSSVGSQDSGVHSPPLKNEAKILQSWPGDFPVARLGLLPEGQRKQAVGYIDDPRTFEGIWRTFKQDEDLPIIDFKANLVLFARNTRYYNRISIGKVNVNDGAAEVLAMETMSAMPIEEKVAISLVVVPREGIRAIQSGDKLIPIQKVP